VARNINETLQQQRSLANTYQGLAELERRRGHFNEAQHWWREAARVRGEEATAPRYQAGLGAIYLDMGQRGLARECFQRALADWTTEPRFQQEHAVAHLRLAQIEFADGRLTEALEQLAQALSLAARFGSDQFLLAHARRAHSLLLSASQQWTDHAQLRSLLERVEHFQPGLAQFAETEVAAPEQPDVNLDILAFGIGRVRRNGELIPNSAWASNKSRALFMYIAERGQVSKNDIALDFWPDYSPEKVNSNFHATLWRIRHALGQEVLVFNDNCYSLSPTVKVWYDVAEFEARLQEAASPALAVADRAELWRQAVGVYEDDYLKDVTMDWANQRRVELQSQYLATLIHLAQWERNRKHFKAAQAFYEKAIEIEPYHDEAYAGLMDCLAELGQLQAARSYFLAYEKQLRVELSTSPPRFLRDRYDKLRQ
jgi:DNA-binding SARP family transcriptional activator